jgi:hypothetical protein
MQKHVQLPIGEMRELHASQHKKKKKDTVKRGSAGSQIRVTEAGS